MKNIKIGIVMTFALLLSVGLSAQRGRGGYGNHYQQNNRYSHYPNNRISVNVGPRYGYYPSYRPSYRPTYRSSYGYAPVYRPMVRPVYRSPAPYVRFGPAFGFRLSVLPFGYSRIYVGSDPYYYNDGIYYRSYNNGGYEVVEPPLNATVTKLPANAVVTVVDGQKYYQVGGTFYQEEYDENNRVAYRVVGTDGVLNTDNQLNTNDQNEEQGTMNTTVEELPVMGSRYDELPAGAKVQVINQQKYFVSGGGVYYKEVIEGDKVRYEVTSVD